MFADWRVDFTDRASAVPVTVASPEVFAADATRLGIGADTVVVAYDHYFNVLAGRIVLVLRSYGHAASHVLDGGLSAWTRGRPARSRAGTSSRRRPIRRTRCRPAGRGLIDLDGMRAGDPDGAQLLDARKTEEYSGRETHARRAGHIPGALNVPVHVLLDADGRFLARRPLWPSCGRLRRRPRPADRRLLQRRRVGHGRRQPPSRS